jgi:predicted dehydrogenase
MKMNKLRLIQCGVGGMGDAWIQGATTKSPDFDLVAIVDVVPQNLEKIGEQIGLAQDKRFASLENALEAVEADAVLTVTPPPVHVQHARLTFAKGLHLLTEKPMGASMEDALEMARLARESKRQLVVSQNYRYSAMMQKLADLMEEKPVGEFGHGHMDFYIPADFTGSFREDMEHVLLVDMAIHHLDLIRAVTKRDIARVTAHSFRPAWSWYKGESALKMLLELEGGGEFSYSGDWSGKGRATSWSGNWRLQCENGSIQCELDKISIARSERWGKEEQSETVEIPSASLTGQAATLSLFAQAIRSGVPAPISGEDNLKSFGAVMAGVKSAQEKRAVSIDEMLNP